jgi:hypothetical protein
MQLLNKIFFLLVAFNLLLIKPIYADICFSEEDARRLLKELKECKINEEILKEQEKAIENLKRQVELYKEEVKLLKEIIELEKSKSEIYKVAYEEEKKRKSLSLFEKGKMIGFGILVGLVSGFFVLK